MKPRSYRSVIAAGFRLYTENFRRLLKASWLLAAVYAVCNSAAGALAAIKIPEVALWFAEQASAPEGADSFDQTASSYLLLLLAICLLTAVSMLALLIAHSAVISKLREHYATAAISIPARWTAIDRKSLWRTLKGGLATAACILLPLVLLTGVTLAAEQFSSQPMASHATTLTAVLIVIDLIVAVGSLPLFYHLMKYLMDDSQRFWPSLAADYARGLRHISLLFVVFLLSTLLTGLAMLVITLPASILQMAHMTAQAGLLIGDQLGMPAYMGVLTFVTFALCSFMGFYVSLPIIFHNYFAFGAIEAKEQIRQQQKQDLQ